jgi:hypothetical protein
MAGISVFFWFYKERRGYSSHPYVFSQKSVREVIRLDGEDK